MAEPPLIPQLVLLAKHAKLYDLFNGICREYVLADDVYIWDNRCVQGTSFPSPFNTSLDVPPPQTPEEAIQLAVDYLKGKSSG